MDIVRDQKGRFMSVHGDSVMDKEEFKKAHDAAIEHQRLEGLTEGWEINFKRLVARELDLDKQLQEQFLTTRETMLNQQIRFLEQANQVAVQAMQAFANNMDERQKEQGKALARKEQKGEERAEELEEQMARQTSTINEQIAGIIEILVASGVLKVASENVPPKE